MNIVEKGNKMEEFRNGSLMFSIYSPEKIKQVELD